MSFISSYFYNVDKKEAKETNFNVKIIKKGITGFDSSRKFFLKTFLFLFFKIIFFLLNCFYLYLYF